MNSLLASILGRDVDEVDELSTRISNSIRVLVASALVDMVQDAVDFAEWITSRLQELFRTIFEEQDYSAAEEQLSAHVLQIQEFVSSLMQHLVRDVNFHEPLDLDDINSEELEFEVEDDDDYEDPERMTLEEISLLPLKTMTISDLGDGESDRICSICLEEYREFDAVRIVPCGHEFHMRCIDQWLSIKGVCPMCRKSLSDCLFD